MRNLLLVFFILFSFSLKAQLTPELKLDLTQTIKDLEKVGTTTTVECPDPQVITKGKKHSIVCANGSEAELTVLSEEEVNLLFWNFKNSDLPFAYPEDGCYARAHKMCMEMEKKGINSAKIFVEGNLQVESPYAVGGKVTWWYHVAPVVLMKKQTGEIETVVIDPSIMDKAVPVKDWVGKMTQCQGCRRDKQYFTAKFNYFPHNKMDKVNKFQDVKEMEKILKDYKLIHDKRLVLKKQQEAGSAK